MMGIRNFLSRLVRKREQKEFAANMFASVQLKYVLAYIFNNLLIIAGI